MHERPMAPATPRVDVPEAVRVQILATEHWSLLATRNIAYGAIFGGPASELHMLMYAHVGEAPAGSAR
jgi:hypothetical protein